MYSKKRFHISLISQDIVFVQLMEFLFRKSLDCPVIEKYYSIVELKKKEEIISDLVVLDDIVEGAASFEVISYLRFNQRFINTICFFGEDDENMRIHSLRKGANSFYKKPFSPEDVVGEIVNNLDTLD